MGIATKLFSVLFICTMGLSIPGLSSASEQAEPSVLVAADSDGNMVEVHPLDDPDNPYFGQYDPWDTWIYDNYHYDFQQSEYSMTYSPDGFIYSRKDGVPLPEHWQYKFGAVDAEGFLIPAMVFYSMPRPGPVAATVRDLMHRSDRTATKSPFRLFGSSVYPPELKQAYDAAFSLEDAKRHPLVPAWLGNNLPQKTVFMPNGEILTYGELGLHYSTSTETRHKLSTPGPVKLDPWYRYSANGELLGTMTIDRYTRPVFEPWRDLYCDNFNEMINEYVAYLKESEGISAHRFSTRGYIGVLSHPKSAGVPAGMIAGNAEQELRIVWDIYGNEVDPNTALEADFNFAAYPQVRGNLEIIYAAQIELGLVAPADQSPFADLENGPVVIDSTPRMPTYMARHWSELETTIEVQPLDDPANPYFGQYESWDTWLMANLGLMNPRQSEYQSARFSEQMEEREKLLAEGKEIPSELFSYPIYRQPEDDPWKSHEIHVDGDGWVVPVRQYMAANNARRFAMRDLRTKRNSVPDYEYFLHAGGVMPADMQADYDLARWQAQSPYLPNVPDWLAEAPVYSAVFVPNGDIVTLGPLGCRPENANELSKEEKWQDFERGWYRYDAGGNLVDSYAMSTYEWPLLYDGHYRELVNSAEQKGLKAATPHGYVVFSNPDTEEVKAVFNYDGSPLDPNQPLYREANYCVILQWNRIAWIHRMQDMD